MPPTPSRSLLLALSALGPAPAALAAGPAVPPPCVDLTPMTPGAEALSAHGIHEASPDARKALGLVSSQSADLAADGEDPLCSDPLLLEELPTSPFVHPGVYFRTRRGSSLVFLGGDMCAAYLLEAHHCWTPHRPGGVVELSPVRRLVVERSVGRGGAGIRVVHLERGDNRPDEPVRTLVILEAWRYVAGYTHSEELLAYLGEGDRFTPIGRLAVITNTAMQAPGTLRGVTREGRYAVGLDGLEVEQVLWGREGRRYERPTCSEPPRGLGPGRYRRVRWRFDGRRMVEQVLRERRATPAEERWLADDCVG